MKPDRIIKEALLFLGAILPKKTSKTELESLAACFRNSVVEFDLVRIGGDADGGYLVPNDLDGVKFCFSPGVSGTSDFENDLADMYQIKSFMADASVDAPAIENAYFDFDKKFIGSHNEEPFTTLSNWMADKSDEISDHELILQMDIEGFEFDVLIETPDSILMQYRIMVIEFHDMDRVFEASFARTVRAVFEKLHKYFAVVHVHANNYCIPSKYKGVSVPPVFEVTYLRKDRLPQNPSNNIKLPHSLDKKNVRRRKDVVMPEIWWK
jgi:hypothetical protein